MNYFWRLYWLAVPLWAPSPVTDTQLEHRQRDAIRWRAMIHMLNAIVQHVSEPFEA